jgi:hypothetical protein
MWGKHDTMDDLVTLGKGAEPADGCETYTNPSSVNSKRYAYFIKSGGKCSLSTQIHNAQVAGAVALVIQHSNNDLSQIQVPDHMSGTLYFPLNNFPLYFC